MKNNLPITSIEYVLKEHETIVSKTDLKGNITYVNSDFVRISGFTSDELIGSPQNILRHPDMPAEAFADFWKTIKSGKAWTGLVKNRCKNGDFYWVEANAAPLIENGETVGYTSIRVKPSRAQIAAAEKAYEEIRRGMKGLRVHEGAVVSDSKILFGAPGKSASIQIKHLLATLLVASLFGINLIAALGGEGYRYLAIISSLTGVAVAAATNYYLLKSSTRPLATVREHIRKMSAGDLASRIEANGDDAIADLFNSLRVLQANFKVVIGQIREAAIVVNSGAHGIVDGNSDLAARTESQASALEETASSMEELTSTVRHNADNANEANVLVVAAATAARTGGQVVEQVVTTMASIRESSRRVGDIIDVINGIAFQSNILALNAAVEAARAGEHGRGFAVVASEVRALSLRSAAAAKEIALLISDSMDKVEDGNKMVKNAGATMTEVVDQVQRVAGYMSDISIASREQSQGIEQINQAILQMDDVTQKNASLVERAAAASAEMLDQARNLGSLVDSFTLLNRQRNATTSRTDRPLAIVPARGHSGSSNETGPNIANVSLRAIGAGRR